MRTCIAILIGAAFLTVACSQTQVVASLEAAIAAAEFALPIVAQQVNLDPAVKAQVLAYLRASNTALTEVAAALSSGGSQASIAARIVAAVSAVPAANLPAGTPQVIVAAINTVAVALEGVLQQFMPYGSARMMATVSAPLTLAASDKRAIGKAHTRLVENAAALAKIGR